MTPRPEDGSKSEVEDCNAGRDKSGFRLSHPPPGDEVVIAGIAGYFPDSANMYELRENLFNKVDLVSDDDRRWKLAHPEIPQRTGKIVHVNRFDASFFGVHFKQAHTMDPMCRMLLEKAYEAIIDAGVNPKSLKNTNTGVFVGGCFSESEKTWFYEKMQVNGFGITGCSRAMLANRISYWLGVTGPSFAVDSACSSSLYALEQAYRAIRDGHCDAAIVGGTNLCLHPYVSLQFSRLGVLSAEGRCRSFDNNASGYARAEAIAAIFLQKSKDARRAYVQVLHAKTNCDGFKEQGITYPAGHIQKLLLKDFYEECKINKDEVEYIECHGTGTRVGDPEELIALDEVFGRPNDRPLLIGSVKSNLGHSEPASGVCSLAKMCIAYDTGYIPPNLFYEIPREGVDALIDGRLKVVTDKTPWNRGLSGVSSFGFGGANAHVVLKHIAKQKVNNGLPEDSIPRLVCVSGRTESAVKKLLDDLESKPMDAEQIRLIHAIHEQEISGHVFRGFSVLRPHSDEMRAAREVQYYSGSKRQVWFVFSGMGSQWPGMGRDLMQLPIFAKAIERCDKVLRPRGIDIVRIICDEDPNLFENILNSFVGIAAIQIGICDVLKALGIEPDFLIGHSVGELGCAYADECFDTEQMILSAYSRGLASIETPLIKGSMAAVGLGFEEVQPLCPDDIEVACHNASNSSTISGPAESIKNFVAQLVAKGVFAKEVNSSNIAYHSRYISKAGPTLLKYLKEVIPNPKQRSKRWISTSVLQKNWNNEESQYSSAEYHTNNLLSSVLFEESSKLIPANAVTIEIAPHGLLQAILRRSMKKECINIGLTRRGAGNQVEFMMAAIGKLYFAGLNPILANLYPEIKFPVSAGTPMLSPLVEWEHSEDWYVTSYRTQEKIKSGERVVRMTIADEDMEYMAGHVIDGRNLYPATGYLVLVWETLALMNGQLFTEVSVVFENVKFMRATNIPKEGNLEFTVMIQKGSGNFEIIESGAAIVSGRIYAEKDISQNYRPLPEPKEPTGEHLKPMTTKDVYKELRLRGYNYTGAFKGVLQSNIDGTKGTLMWVNNWVTFMDTMMQMKILTIDTRGMFVPTRIDKISIDSTKHYAILSAIPDNEQKELPVTLYQHLDFDIIRSGGVEVRGLYASAVSRRSPSGIPVLERYEFIPFYPKQKLEVKDAIRNSIQLLLENAQGIRVKAVELIDAATQPTSEPLAPIILDSLGDLPLVQAEILVISNEKLDLGSAITVDNKKLTADMNALLFVGSKLIERDDVLQQASVALNDKGFIISREALNLDLDSIVINLDVIGSTKTDKEQLVLLKKRASTRPSKFVHVKSEDDKFTWIEPLKDIIRESHKVVLVSEGEPLSGVLGLVNCLRKEPGGDIVSCVAIMDKDAPKFNADLAMYEEQLDKQLAISVYKNGQWGSYRHLVVDELQTIKAEHAYLNALTYGDLSSLKWVQGSLRPTEDANIVNVYYASLNFRDTMIASGRVSVEAMSKGRINQDCAIGMEFSGRLNNGQRVMGMSTNRCMANIVSADMDVIWPIPDDWTLAEAATVPVTYCTIVYAFFIAANFEPGCKILIHAGTGGVGQSAINVCLYYGCEIFTTVGSQEKKEFIMKKFPQIKESHIGNSRDTSFEDMVMRETGGKGVDIVLNSLAEEKLQASVRCLAFRGQFLEIGKFDIVNNNKLGMSFFIKECSFHGIMMDAIFQRDTGDKPQLRDLLMDHLKKGCIKPLCHTEFDINECEKAFRFISSGKHLGKVMIRLRPEEKEKVIKPNVLLLDALPRYRCHPEFTYIVIGGLGGFGLELTDWLVLRGAKKIILNSRRGVVNGYQSLRIKTWTAYGVKIVVTKDDVSTQKGVENLLKNASALGSVRGIFNLAVVLKDAIFENQTPESFATSFAPKATATKILDAVSRKLCPDLSSFVIFSSVSCGRGNAGQTNYGMANSIMERICEERKKAGYPALAVQWGAVGEVGLVADMQEEHMELEIGGTLQQKIGSCLKTMDIFLSQPWPIVSSMVVAEKKAGGSGDGDIAGTIAGIMGLKDLKTVSHQVTLAELGMDSIMAVEIKQSLEREYEIILTAQDVRTLTFARLIELAAKREADASTTAPVKDIGGLRGLKMLIRNVGDEASAAENIVNLPTMISDGKNNHEDICETTPRIFMIPGIEGMAAIYETLGKRLKCKASVLQLGYDHPDQDILNISKRLLESMKSRIVPKSQFVLLGYSFGVAITIEIAKVLEAEGHIGRIFLIDGSPEFLQGLMKANLQLSDLKHLEDTLLCLVLDIIAPKNKENILPALEECTSWDDKVELFLKYVPDVVQHSKQYQRCMANTIYERLKSTMECSTAPAAKKLKSTAILMRPKDLPQGITIEENYGLNNFFETPVKVHLLEGNHISIIDNKDCANIINKSMSDLLKEAEAKNSQTIKA